MKSKEKISKLESNDRPGLEGDRKPEYVYEFSDGKKFEVVKEKNGEIRLALNQNGQEIFDFSDFLPEDWKFVSSDYIRKLAERTKEDIPWFGWLADYERKLLQIGDFESPKDFLTLLHEIGHAQKNRQKDLIKYSLMLKRLFPTIAVSPKPLKSEHARIASKVEREAWAYGLLLFRKLKNQFGLDIKNLFPTFSDLHDFINENLSEYWKTYEEAADAELDPEFYEELKKVFDRD